MAINACEVSKTTRLGKMLGRQAWVQKRSQSKMELWPQTPNSPWKMGEPGEQTKELMVERK